MDTLRKIFYLTTAFLFLLIPFGEVYGQTKFIFGVVPQFTPQFIYQAWGPVLREISSRSGYTFELKIKESIPEFERSLLRGEFDFAFMNPYHMVMAKRAKKYEPIIRDRSPLKGIIVVKKDSSIQRLEDLNGSTIVFPAPNAFGASLYMRALLTDEHKIKFSPKYVQTHDNVYRHVIIGLAQAGGGVNQTLIRQPEDIRNGLRILYETPGTAPHPIAVHSRVPKNVRELFLKLFSELSKEQSFRQNFKDMQIPDPVTAYYGRDYAPLEKLNLEKYLVRE